MIDTTMYIKSVLMFDHTDKRQFNRSCSPRIVSVDSFFCLLDTNLDLLLFSHFLLSPPPGYCYIKPRYWPQLYRGSKRLLIKEESIHRYNYIPRASAFRQRRETKT